MVFPMVQALDNPLVLLEMLKTPEGKQAAAVMLAQAGVTPEKFETKVAQAANPTPLQHSMGESNMAMAPMFSSSPGQGWLPNGTFQPASSGGGGLGGIFGGMGGGMGGGMPSLPGIGGAGGGQPQQPPMLPPPAAVPPNPGNPSALNAGTVAQLIQLMMAGGVPQQQQGPQSLGQIFAGR